MSEETVDPADVGTPNSRPPRVRPRHVMLFLRSGTNLTAVSSGPAGSGWTQLDLRLLPALADQLRNLGYNRASVRAFAMRPQDLRIWDQGVHHGSDGWAYGTVWGSDTKIDAQVQIKELHQAPVAIDPMAVFTAVAVARLQAQVEALTDLVEDVGADVKSILRFLHVEQDSQVRTAIGTIAEVHVGSQAAGRVSRHDWDRVAGLEQVLLSQHRALVSELSTDAETLQFGTLEQAKNAARIDCADLDRRLALDLLLLRAMAQWNEVMLAAKAQSGELRDGEAQQVTQRFTDHLEDTHAVINELSRTGGRIEPRPWWRALVTEGIVGRRKHEQLREAKALEVVEAVHKVAERYGAVPDPNVRLPAGSDTPILAST